MDTKNTKLTSEEYRDLVEEIYYLVNENLKNYESKLGDDQHIKSLVISMPHIIAMVQMLTVLRDLDIRPIIPELSSQMAEFEQQISIRLKSLIETIISAGHKEYLKEILVENFLQPYGVLN